MRELAIYLEGGGSGAQSKATLRQGMGEFLFELRELARNKRLHWKIVACGGRGQAFRMFRNSVRQSDGSVSVLLVDSEGPLLIAPQRHLRQRDGWDLGFACESAVQLMVQTMETWIVADATALASYYGPNFACNAIPGLGADLEGLDRNELRQRLDRAIGRTAKQEYRKIRDGSALLARINPVTVQRRCPSCRRLFDTVKVLIAGA